MNRTATWTKVGTDIRSAKNYMEALHLSGLDYEVEKAPIFLGNGLQVSDYFATKEVNSDRTFGIVGKDYTIIQNKEAFQFIDSIIPEGLEFVKAGETKKGTFLITKLPSHYILGDEVTPYLILQNSHNGTTTLRSAICPLRIVCQNQFTRAFKEADNTISIRHSSSAELRMEEAKKVLQFSASYMDCFKKEAEEMATKKLSESQVESIVETYFYLPAEATQKKAESIQQKKQQFLTAYNAEDNQNFKGTAWGLVNAFTDYHTHQEPKKDTELSNNRKFLKVSLDTKPLEQFISMVKATA